MWDADNSTRNFSISRLLWAFRDTPYYKDLQAFWIVHAPQGALAEVMWEEGARDRSLEEIIDDALERHNEYANSKPIDPSKQKNRMPGEGPRDKLTTGLDTRTVAVLSHDDTGQALHIWMAHQLKALVGSGSPPKVIRDPFINTGAPSLDLVMKQNQALKAAQDAEFARRARKANEIQSELARHPGPERTKELRDEFAALLAPPDDSDDPIEQAKKKFSSSAISECVVARDSLLASYLDRAVCGDSGFGLPDLLSSAGAAQQ